jgi:hypothetical protein
MVMAPVFFQQEETRIVAAPDNPAIDAPPFLTSRGTGVDGVGALVIHRTDGAFLCTGSMIAPMWVLTAAHCLSDTSGNMITNSVDETFFPNPSGTLNMTSGAGSFFVNPLYNGAVGSDYDIALVRLPSPVGPGVDVYSLYTGSITMGNPFTMVGFGMRGGGNTGATLPAGSRRQGMNSFDFFLSPGVLIADFDNGNPANDASCSVGARCDLGLGALEADTAPGDSGGPVFFGNQIVAVIAFGARTSNPPDIDGVLNSSFGEFAGFTSVEFNQAFLDATMAPEPASWAGVALGIAALAWRLQRKRLPH